MSLSVSRGAVGWLLFLFLVMSGGAGQGWAAEAAGGADFVKLDANGRELAADAASWAIIAPIMRPDKEEPFVDTVYFANVRAANYWNFYICGSGAIMRDTKSFGKKSVRAAKQHVMAVRGKAK